VLEVWQGDRLLRSEPALRAAAAGLLPLRDGERAALHVRNASGHSVDMVVVGVDAGGALHAVYPDDPGATNRFERGTREAPAAQRFELPWLQAARGARLLVLATVAGPQTAPRLFGAAPSDTAAGALAGLRLRGQPAPDKARQTYAALLRWPGEGPAAR